MSSALAALEEIEKITPPQSPFLVSPPKSTVLADKAMLVQLTVSQWTGKVVDKVVTSETNARYKATKDAGRYEKWLIPKTAFDPISKIVNQARAFHYEQTLPWVIHGPSILAASNHPHYTEKMRGFKDAFNAAVHDLLMKYYDLRRNAKVSLGLMNNDNDYPTLERISKKFEFKVTFAPVPMARDFRVSLMDDEVKDIKEDLERQLNDAYTGAMRELWQRLYDSVGKLANKLTDADTATSMRSTVIDNMSEMVMNLSRMNFADDPRLETIRRKVENELCTLDAKAIRENGTVRADASLATIEIMKTMEAYMGMMG